MQDQHGNTVHRQILQDGQANSGGSGMPGGSNMVFATDQGAAAAQAQQEQHDAEQAARNAPQSTSKVSTGAHRVTHHADGSVVSENLGLRRGDSAPVPTGSILDNARSQSGQPLMLSEVSADSLVTFQGIEMTVAGLEQLGLVRKSANGGYEDFSQGAVTSPVTVPSTEQADGATDNNNNNNNTEQAPEDIDSSDPARHVELLENLLRADGSLGGDVYNAAIDVVGDPDAGDLLDALPALQDAGPKTSEAFNALHQAKADEAAAVIAKEGVTDNADFLAWARQQGGFSRAMSLHLLEGKPAEAWGQLARTYARDHQAVTDFDTDEVINADFGPGVTVSRGPDGTPWIAVDDFNGPFKEAVRQGKIKVTTV